MKTLFFTGRNPANASGVSWKVWKIKREGRVVETRWGPIKVVNRRMVHSKVLPHKKWPAFETIEAAKEFYEAKVQEKMRAGYEVKPRKRVK